MRAIVAPLLFILVVPSFILGLSVSSVRGSSVGGFQGNVRVNSDVTAGSQTEPSIAADPVYSVNLIAAYIGDTSETPTQPCDTYVSTNLGSSWGSRNVLESGCNDPVVRFKAASTAYLVYLLGNNIIRVQKSTNGGVNWTRLPHDVASTGSDACTDTIDKPWLAIDAVNNIIYVAYWGTFFTPSYCINKTFQVRLAWSNNDGQTWTTQNVTSSITDLVVYPSVAVAPSSSYNVHVAWADFPTTHFPYSGSFTIKSKFYGQGGTNPSGEKIVATKNTTPDTIPGSNSARMRGTISPHIVTAPNPNNSSTYNVYVVYGAAGQSTGDPSDIYFSSSNNGGASWLTPVRLNNDVTIAAQFFPAIAVDSSNNLHVTYGDMSNLSSGQYKISYVESTNGGVSWLPTITVTDAVSDSSQSTFLGDYFDIATNLLNVIPIWTDRRPVAVQEDIYTALSIFGGAGGGGGSILAGTQVLMSDGSSNLVQNLKSGMIIRSFDPGSNSFYDATITSVVVKSVSNLYVTSTSNGNPIRTDYYENFWVQLPNGQVQWMHAGEVQLGYKILRPSNGIWATITSIETDTGTYTVYDLLITPTLQGGPMPVIANGYLDMKCGPCGCTC